MGRYLLDIVGGMLYFARPLISFLLLLLVLSSALWYSIRVPRIAYNALSSTVCNIPGAPVIIPFCKYAQPKDDDEQNNINFTQLMLAQSPFEELIFADKSFESDRHRLPQVSRALKDLAVSMRFSNLGSAETLHGRLRDLSDISDHMFDDLLHLANHMDRTAEAIATRNSHTATRIANIYATDLQRNWLSRTLGNFAASTITGGSIIFGRPASEKIRSEFLGHTNDVLARVDLVLEEALRVQGNLDKMDIEFVAIHELTVQAGIANRMEREESLGNAFNRVLKQVEEVVPGTVGKEEKQKFQANVKLLEDTVKMIKTSSAHVDRQVVQLKEARVALSGLGEQAREAGWEARLKQVWEDVPFAAHLEDIEKGAKSLSDKLGLKRQAWYDEQMNRGSGSMLSGRAGDNEGHLIDSKKRRN